MIAFVRFQGLEKAAKDAVSATHKWTRRWRGPDGAWRYAYSDTSIAHAVSEGETVSVKTAAYEVLAIKGDELHVRDAMSGKTRTMRLADLHEELEKAWGERFSRGAERMVERFTRTARQAARRVPHSDPKALKKLYGERFKEAKVDPETVERLIAFIAPRKGWDDDAKAALLAIASDAKAGRVVAPRARQIAEGAERFRDKERAPRVTPAHVGKSAAARGASDTEAHFAELRTKAREETAKAEALLGAIEAAGNNQAARKAMVEYARAMMGTEAVLELKEAAVAFPGLRELPELQRWQTVLGRWHAVSQGSSKSGVGAPTSVYIADAEGNPIAQTARYRLVEADQAIASHDPAKHFAKRSEYPEGVQERAYHSDKSEQNKVRDNARKLKPAFVVNTNPDAVNGPPVITSDGVVLGGNSRTMSLQLAYAEHPESAEQYRKYLAEHAHEYGFTEAEVAGMKSPVLVREVDTPNAGKEELGVLVRRYNESFTQGMDPRTDQVARGRMVNKAMLQMLAAGMDAEGSDGKPRFDTLRAYLSSSDGARFVSALQSQAEGKAIIDKRNRNIYVGKDGKLNQDGATFVERVLVGHVFPDAELLGDLLPSQVENLAVAVPHIVRASNAGHDITGPLREALQAQVYMRKYGMKQVDDLYSQAELGEREASFGAGPKPKGLARVLLEELHERTGRNQSSALFRDIATAASRSPAGQSSMFGEAPSTEELVQRALKRKPPAAAAEQSSLFKALFKGGPYYGPRGGKYADPQHKVAWHEQQIDMFAESRSTDANLAEVTHEDVERDLKSLGVPLANPLAHVEGGVRSGVESTTSGTRWVTLAWKDYAKKGEGAAKFAAAIKLLESRGWVVNRSRYGEHDDKVMVGRPKPAQGAARKEGRQMSLFKALFRGFAYVSREVEIPAWMGASIEGLSKGAGHKYIRRVPKPGGGYRYFYRVTGGHGLAHDNEIVAGAAFAMTHDGKAGHFHVVSVDGGKVTIRHDESGKTETIDKAALRSMLHEHHAEAIKSSRERIKRDIAAAEKNKASDKSKASLKEELGRHEKAFGGTDEATRKVNTSAKIAKQVVTSDSFVAMVNKERHFIETMPLHEAIKTLDRAGKLSGVFKEHQIPFGLPALPSRVAARTLPEAMAVFERLVTMKVEARDEGARIGAEHVAQAINDGLQSLEIDNARLASAGIVAAVVDGVAHLSGNTKEHKAQIQAAGGKWNSLSQRWEIAAGGVARLEGIVAEVGAAGPASAIAEKDARMNLSKTLFRGFAYVSRDVEIPAWMGASIEGLFKGAGHKYIRRVPKPGGGYRYFYRVTGGHGLAHDNEIVAGAAFAMTHDGKAGHFHVVSVDGMGPSDKVTIRHDESGKTETIERAALRSMLHEHHAEAIKSNRARIERDKAAADKHGASAKAKAKIAAELDAHEHAFGREQEKPLVGPEDIPEKGVRLRNFHGQTKAGEVMQFKGKYYVATSVKKERYWEGLSMGYPDDEGTVWFVETRPATVEEALAQAKHQRAIKDSNEAEAALRELAKNLPGGQAEPRTHVTPAGEKIHIPKDASGLASPTFFVIGEDAIFSVVDHFDAPYSIKKAPKTPELEQKIRALDAQAKAPIPPPAVVDVKNEPKAPAKPKASAPASTKTTPAPASAAAPKTDAPKKPRDKLASAGLKAEKDGRSIVLTGNTYHNKEYIKWAGGRWNGEAWKISPAGLEKLKGVLKSLQPTPAQAAAGNYKKQHRRFAGLDISIENPAGSTRSGVSPDGKPWSTTMQADYGYIKRTRGADGDHIDVYLGPNEDAENAFIVHQVDPESGTYDEDKVMLGYDSVEDARRAYMAHYDSRKFFGDITEMPIERFRERIVATRVGVPVVPEAHHRTQVARRRAVVRFAA